MNARFGTAGAVALALLVAAGADARAQLALAPAVAVDASARPLPSSTLSARLDGRWVRWWRADSAPARWSASPAPLARAARWSRGADGIEWTELALGGSGEAWRTRVVVARLDPARVAFRLDTAFTGRALRRRPAWTVEDQRARRDVHFAVNAGQFRVTMPWGWVVLDGREWRHPDTAPLASAFVVDAAGRARLEHGGRPAPGDARWAFQSYPTLLAGGAVPVPLRAPGRGVDLAHRDARAALGIDAEGRVLVALTRFDALGGRLDFVPFGLTVPETAALMGALGATDAVMLDGGISAQLLLRDARGRARAWEGLRAVPLALVATQRR